jgi:hypothetical protein
LEEAATAYRSVHLPARGVGERQADDLRARLKTFAEDWERPEASIYDEDPARSWTTSAKSSRWSAKEEGVEK